METRVNTSLCSKARVKNITRYMHEVFLNCSLTNIQTKKTCISCVVKVTEGNNKDAHLVILEAALTIN